MSLQAIHSDVLVRILSFSDYRDVCHSEQCCVFWRQMLQNSSVWKHQNIKDRIPLVDSDNRDHKHDFKVLLPRTITARQIACLGEFVGDVPMLSVDDFNRLLEKDSFEPSKLNSETILLIVEPQFIKRSFDQKLLDVLNKKGDAPEIIGPDKELLIPYTFKNLIILSDHPLINKNKGPVVGLCSGFILDQCNSSAKKVNLSFMRIKSPPQSCGITFLNQTTLLEENGFQMVPLRVRSLSNIISILNTGTCEDNAQKSAGNYVNTADSVAGGTVCIGMFATKDPAPGLRFGATTYTRATEVNGAIPYLALEATNSTVSNRGQWSNSLLGTGSH